MDQYDEAFEAGQRAALRELEPLVEAITDAVFMFKDIEKARQLPAFGNVIGQYIAMGNQLERCLKLSPLRHLIPERKE